MRHGCRPLRIVYLLESTELSGGVRVVFDQARALAALGHRVTIRSRMGDHGWYPYPVCIDYQDDLAQHPHGETPDVAVATFWTTVAPLLRTPALMRVHLCQGLEFALHEYAPLESVIKAAYAHPIPKLTVGSWLDEELRAVFGPRSFPVFSVGQIVDADLFRYRPLGRLLGLLRPHPLRVLLVGMYPAAVKGISIGLDAVRIARARGASLELLRASPLPPQDEELHQTPIGRYHVCLKPRQMATLYQEAHVLLAPSFRQEGFGLPFAEALATGLPAIATRIPSTLSFASPHTYAAFVDEGDPRAMAAALLRLAKAPVERLRLSLKGYRVVRGRFSASAAALAIETIFHRLLALSVSTAIPSRTAAQDEQSPREATPCKACPTLQ